MKRLFGRKVFQIALIAANVLLAAWIVRSHGLAIIDSARNVLFDQYQRLKPRENIELPVRIIDIDDASVNLLGQWPWPRSRMAAMTDRLAELGAAAITYDIVFSEPDRTNPATIVEEILDQNGYMDPNLRTRLKSIPDNDRLFAESLKEAPSVIGFFGSSKQTGISPRQSAGIVVAGDDPKSSLIHMEGAITSLPALQEAASGIGTVSLAGGRTSDVIRRAPLFISDGINIFPALSIEALRIATGESTYVLKTATASGEASGGTGGMVAARVADFIIPTTTAGEIQLYYAPEDTSDYIPAVRLLDDDYRHLAPLVEGHIVFVGTSAVGLSDLRVTALGQTVPGVSLHAQIVKQILTESYLQRPDWAAGAEMAMTVIVTLLMVAVLPYTGAFVSALFGALCSICVLAISWFAFVRHGILIEPIFAMATGGAVYILSITLTYAATEREKRFVRSAFQQYMAPSLLKKLEAAPEELVLGGEIRNITMMFLDIRSFTGISEKLRPDELVAFINTLFSPLSDIIQSNDGIIDKYIGDSIMAFWNAPVDVSDHQQKACMAALQIVDTVEKLNREDEFGFRRRSIEIPGVRIGIGINTGEACVGNMGSTSRFDYSAIGDTVNIAARIEAQTKAMGWPILVSETTIKSVPRLAFLFVGNLLLRGKSNELGLYALVGDADYASSPQYQELKRQHDLLFSPGKNRDEAETRALLKSCVDLAPAHLAPLYSSPQFLKSINLAP